MERSKNQKRQFALLAAGGAVLVVGLAGVLYGFSSRQARAAGGFTITGSATSQTSISITWSGGPGGEAEIERNGSFLTGGVGSTNAGSYNDTSLVCGTSYTYVVWDIDFGESSDPRTISTQACAPSDTTPPSLSSRNPTPGTYYRNPPLNVAVTYSDNVGVAYVRHCFGFGTCDPGTTAASTFTNGAAIDSGTYDDAPGSTGYYLCTRARDSAGNWSANDCGWYARRMAAPSSLTISLFGGDDVDMQWYDNSSEENGYYVERSFNGQAYTSVTTTPAFGGAGAANYQDYNVPCGFLKYRVIVFRGSSDSVVSNESNTVSYTCAVSPPTLTNATTSLTYGTNASVTLYWNQNTPPVPDGFHIFRNGAQIGSASGPSARDYTDGSSSPPQCGTTYTYVVRAYTNSGQNADSSPRAVTTPACPNTAPPTPTILQPASSSWTTNTQMCASVSAPESGQQVRGEFNGVFGGYVTTSGSSCATWTGGSAGNVNLQVRAQDQPGSYSGYASRTVNFDVTAPSVPGTPSGSPNPSSNGSYTVSWSASSDGHSGLASYDVYENGSYERTTTGTSVGYSGKAGGTYTYRVLARDNVGNVSGQSGSGSVTVSINSAPNTPTLTQPANSSWTSSASLCASVSDPDSGQQVRAEFYWDSGSTQTNYVTTSGTPCTGWTAGSSANVPLRVRAQDAAGVYSGYSATRTVNFDFTAPTVPGTPSGSPNPSSNGSYTVSWSASSDGHSGLASYDVYENGSYNRTVSGTTSAGYSGKGSGTYTYFVLARDNVGNVSGQSGSGSVTVSLDSTPPTISDNWTDNWTINSPVTVTISASDASGVWYIATCSDWDNTCDPADGTFTYASSVGVAVSCPDLSGCTQYVRYQAADNSGSHNVSGIGSKRVRQDRQIPSTPTLNQSASTPTPTSGSTITVGWNASTDAHSGMQRYNICYYRNGSLCGSCTWNTTSQLTSTMPGACISGDATYRIVVSAVDNVGNDSIDRGGVLSYDVIRDTTPPTAPGVCSVTPNPSTGDFSVNWGASTDPAPSSVLYGYYMQYSTNGGSTWSDTVPGVTQPIQYPPVAVTGMAIGGHTYRTRAADYRGNFSNWSSSCTATVQSTDTAAPTISVSVIPNTPSGRTWSTNCTATSSTNCTTSSNQPTIRITYSDSAGISATTPVGIQRNGAALLCTANDYFSSCSANNSQMDIVFRNRDNNGIYTIPLGFIRDTLGNARTDTLTITVDNQAPTVTIQ